MEKRFHWNIYGNFYPELDSDLYATDLCVPIEIDTSWLKNLRSDDVEQQAHCETVELEEIVAG